MTLKQWADKSNYCVLGLIGRIARVDKRPSEWFAPQWMILPDDVEVSFEDRQAYEVS